MYSYGTVLFKKINNCYFNCNNGQTELFIMKPKATYYITKQASINACTSVR